MDLESIILVSTPIGLKKPPESAENLYENSYWKTAF